MEVLMAINGSHTQMTSTIGNRHVLCSLGWVWRMGNGAPPAIAHKSHSFINLLAQSCDQELEECRKYENMFYLNRITLLLCRPIIDLTGIGRNETNAKNACLVCLCCVNARTSEWIAARNSGETKWVFVLPRARARSHTHIDQWSFIDQFKLIDCQFFEQSASRSIFNAKLPQQIWIMCPLNAHYFTIRM